MRRVTAKGAKKEAYDFQESSIQIQEGKEAAHVKDQAAGNYQ